MPQYAKDEAGNIWEVDAQGNPLRMTRPASGPQGNVFTLPQDPSKAATTQGNVLDNQITSATMADAIAKARADAVKAQADAAKAQADLARGGLTPEQISEKNAKIAQFNSLVAQINRVQELYNSGPGATKGIDSLKDYLPSDANSAFDAAGAALSQQGLGAFRIPGTGTVSDRDAIMFDRANLPTADTRDAAIEEQLRGLRSRLEVEYQSRGLPVPRWTGLEGPQTEKQKDNPPALVLQAANGGSNSPLTPLDQSGPGGQRVATGGTKTISDPATAAALNAMFAAGATFEQINQFAQAQGAAPLDPMAFAAAKDYAAKRKGYQPFTATRTEPTTAMERLSASPAGSAAAGFANTMSMGGVQALAPEAFQASQDANPWSGIGGSALGAIAPTAAIGALGRNTLGRLAPRLMGGGGGAQFGRNLAADATYGAGFGTVTEGDPLSGAGAAALGSAGGQIVGSTLGRAVGGLSQTPAAQALVDRGIKLTTGQRSGGMLKGFEDRLSGLNVIGDMVNARRLEGFRDYNAAEFADAGRPIGFTPTEIADTGLQQLDDAKGAAYQRYLDPAQIDTLNDPQLVQDVAQARIAASQIPNVQPSFPRDYAEQSLQNRLQGPVDPNGMLSGRNFQESYRGLARDARSRANSDYGYEIGQTARLGQDALAGALERQNPGAFQGFKAANQVNRRAAILADAVNRARTGGRTGEVDVFAPSQFIDAAAANKNKFPGGLDTSLAKNAQEVMPNKVPDSGTAGRMAFSALALPALFGGGGAALDQSGLTDSAAMRGLAIGALLTAGGTKSGQAALNKVLFDRPQTAAALGALIRKHKGLFGSASIPLALEAGN